MTERTNEWMNECEWVQIERTRAGGRKKNCEHKERQTPTRYSNTRTEVSIYFIYPCDTYAMVLILRPWVSSFMTNFCNALFGSQNSVYNRQFLPEHTTLHQACMLTNAPIPMRTITFSVQNRLSVSVICKYIHYGDEKQKEAAEGRRVKDVKV